MPLADGRYLARREGGPGDEVLVLQTIAAPARPSRRRRRPRESDVAESPAELPLARATAIRAFEPFEGAEEGAAWLARTIADEEATDAAIGAGVALLNEALHAHAIAAADPFVGPLPVERAVAVRVGHGSGEETAEGAFREAHAVDVWATGSSRRRRRQEEVRPGERVAAILRGREAPAACETLLLRARADLDAGRDREAALQLQAGLVALLAELPEMLDDEDHRRDIASLEERLPEVEAAAERALSGDLDDEARATVSESLAMAERVLRRRRVLAS